MPAQNIGDTKLTASSSRAIFRDEKAPGCWKAAVLIQISNLAVGQEIFRSLAFEKERPQ